MMNDETIKAKIRTVRDWPKAGVNFRDVTTLFEDTEAFQLAVDKLAELFVNQSIDRVAAVDARGFILGGALAYKLGKPLAMVRKKGKLPHKTISAEYDLEYGSACIEVHQDTSQKGDRVVIIDDLIATGGTLLASVKLFRQLESDVVGVAAVVDLPDLGGSRLLREAGLSVSVLCSFTESE
jgi:adenine phosphoribosyltransferase